MPGVMVYIRQEDFEKWKSIVNKSEFIHLAIQSTEESEDD